MTAPDDQDQSDQFFWLFIILMSLILLMVGP
jgi:hypothetical protein